MQHCCRNDSGGQRTRKVLMFEILSSWQTPLLLVDPGWQCGWEWHFFWHFKKQNCIKMEDRRSWNSTSPITPWFYSSCALPSGNYSEDERFRPSLFGYWVHRTIFKVRQRQEGELGIKPSNEHLHRQYNITTKRKIKKHKI